MDELAKKVKLPTCTHWQTREGPVMNGRPTLYQVGMCDFRFEVTDGRVTVDAVLLARHRYAHKRRFRPEWAQTMNLWHVSTHQVYNVNISRVEHLAEKLINKGLQSDLILFSGPLGDILQGSLAEVREIVDQWAPEILQRPQILRDSQVA